MKVLKSILIILSLLFLPKQHLDSQHNGCLRRIRGMGQVDPFEKFNFTPPSAQIFGFMINLSKFLGGGRISIPKEIAYAAEEVLKNAKEQGMIRDYILLRVGGDLYLQMNTHNLGKEAVIVNVLLLEASKMALEKAKELNYYNYDVDFSTLAIPEQIKELEVRELYFGMEEREKTEPMSVYIMINAPFNAFNIPLFECYTNPAITTGLGIAPDIAEYGFSFILRDYGEIVVEDGVRKPREYRLNGKTQKEEINALIKEPSIIIEEVWSNNPKYEKLGPVAKVVFTYLDPHMSIKGRFNPVLIQRHQGGFPAFGEGIMAYAFPKLIKAGDVIIIEEDGEKEMIYKYWRPFFPMPLSEEAIASQGTIDGIGLIGFGYQSNLGKIEEATLRDCFEDYSIWQEYYRQAQELRELIAWHENFPLDVTEEYAQYSARQVWQEYQDRFEPIPESEQIGKGKLTLSKFKADVGSGPGHSGVPEPLLAEERKVAEAAKNGDYIIIADLWKAQETEFGRDIPRLKLLFLRLEKNYPGLVKKVSTYSEASTASNDKIIWWETTTTITIDKVDEKTGKVVQVEEIVPAIGIHFKKPRILDYKGKATGDDGHLNFLHYEGIGDPLIHTIAWIAFYNGAVYAKIHKLYGAGQDLLGDAPSGNVRGSGVGCAEMIVKDPQPILDYSMDKTNPAAANLPMIKLLKNILASEPPNSNGYVVEIYYSRKSETGEVVTERAYFDVRTEMDMIIKLLSDYENSAIKNIWAKNSPQWNPKEAEKYLDYQVFTWTTDRLQNIAGKYVGKDDPGGFMLLNFAQKGRIENVLSHPRFVHGGMRGSKGTIIIPRRADKSIPTRDDGPPVETLVSYSFVFEPNGSIRFNGTPVEYDEDLFMGPYWDSVRIKATQWERWLYAHGPFAPAHAYGSIAEYTTLPLILERLHSDPELSSFTPLEADIFYQYFLELVRNP